MEMCVRGICSRGNMPMDVNVQNMLGRAVIQVVGCCAAGSSAAKSILSKFHFSRESRRALVSCAVLRATCAHDFKMATGRSHLSTPVCTCFVQVRAMRLLQTGADVSASLMISAGGRREHLARPDLNVAPPMDRCQFARISHVHCLACCSTIPKMLHNIQRPF